MYKIIWKFEVKPESKSQFEEAYGRDGTWAKLFRRSDSYLGSELLRDLNEKSTYLTVDSWKSKEEYEFFKANFKNDYSSLDESCGAFTVNEAFVGRYSAV